MEALFNPAPVPGASAVDASGKQLAFCEFFWSGFSKVFFSHFDAHSAQVSNPTRHPCVPSWLLATSTPTRPARKVRPTFCCCVTIAWSGCTLRWSGFTSFLVFFLILPLIPRSCGIRRSKHAPQRGCCSLRRGRFGRYAQLSCGFPPCLVRVTHACRFRPGMGIIQFQ